jgi:hypothetical protein
MVGGIQCEMGSSRGDTVVAVSGERRSEWWRRESVDYTGSVGLLREA